jgi:hypothetical protein
MIFLILYLALLHMSESTRYSDPDLEFGIDLASYIYPEGNIQGDQIGRIFALLNIV